MKILSLWQPWASLIAHDFKKFETRHWETKYRGKLVIHAAKRVPTYDEKEAIVNPLKQSNFKDYSALVKFFGETELPYGAIIAICDLTNCSKMNDALISAISPLEQAVGYWEEGRFAWQLDKIMKLKNPVLFKGNQGLRTLPSIFEEILINLPISQKSESQNESASHQT